MIYDFCRTLFPEGNIVLPCGYIVQFEGNSTYLLYDDHVSQEQLTAPVQFGVTQHALGNFWSALQSHQHGLDIRVKLFGEEHPDTAESYFSIGVTQHALGNFSSAL